MSQPLAIFDYDGTLADTAPWFFANLNEIARRHGFRTVSAAEGEALRDLPTREILRALDLPLWKIPLVAADMRRRVLADPEAMPLFPWVPGLLARLAEAGIAMAIVSSNSETAIRQALGASLPHIRRVSAGTSLFGKPARLKRVIRELQADATRTAVIGDEIRDIEAARAIGARAIAVTWGLASLRGLASARPDELVESPDALAETLLKAA